GSLAVLAAMAYAEVVVEASDISPGALEIARINVARHGLETRVRVVESDLFANLAGRYDLIVCNPPYVNDESMAALPPEYRAEPSLALAGGVDGMDLIRRIVAGAPAHMSDDAVLVIEVGHERAHFEQAFARLECAWLETSGGEDQVVLIERRALAG
ncbi:MAG: HemK family protein methyltransferase, partial [Caldimonas sp.]